METQHIAPEGHPVHTLMEEHSTLLDFTAKLLKLAGELKDASGFASSVDLLTQIKGVIDHFKASQKHYLREENVIFPYLEKHGIAGPPKQMWAEHDQIRDTEKELFGLMDNAAEMDFQDFAAKLELNAQTIAELLAVHYNKENTILFPMAMQVFTEDEWQETIRQFNEIGYCCFS
ncbi:MAG: hemerythrin domain-containing protein, partial [Calditrichaeota bacterium]|nr:hemerythrin domain-containing protein [Calditrichota bacterium]